MPIALQNIPLGWYSHIITKKYLGALTYKFRHLDIERHFYPLIIIEAATNGISQKELADKLQLDKVTMVRMIDYLSEKKYVTRQQNSKDRREHVLTLTGKAIKVLPGIKSTISQLNEEALKGLNKSERMQFFDILENIQNNLDQLPKEPVQYRFRKLKK